MDNTHFVLAVSITTLLVLILIGGIAASFLMAAKQRDRQQLALSATRLAYERELRRVETEVSEHLAQHFAQELHDNIGHTLTCIRLEVENKKLDHPDIVPHIAPLEQYIDEAAEQLRLLSRSLNTDYITTNGLSNAIRIEIERVKQLKKFNVVYQESENTNPPLLDKNQELMAFRILQEAVHNALKHAKASKLAISLSYNPQFSLTIEDDGKGFEWESTIGGPKASGLKNIIKRATMAGMNCLVKTTPGQGCQYILTQKQNTVTHHVT